MSDPIPAVEEQPGRMGAWRVIQSRERQTWITTALIALAVIGPLFLTSERWARVLLLVVVYAILASGLNLLVGFTGLLDLGYIAFFTIGAYFTALLTVRVAIDGLGMGPGGLWWLLFVNLLIGGLVASGFGVVLGYPTLRARGDYLAIMTLAFGEVVRLVALNWTGLTNGPIGIRGVPPVRVGGYEFVDPLFLYYLALAIGGLVVFAIARIVRSHVGRAWVAIRDDELVAECMGVNTHRYKLLAYASGAFFAGLIGVFFAHMQQFINPDSFALEDNMLVLCLVILGGSGTLWGPIVGAALWIIFQEWSSDLGVVQAHPELRLMALGLLILIVVRFLPRGIVPWRPRLSFRARRETPAAEAVAHPDAEPGSVLLRASGVSCRFGGVRALAGVDLEVHPGEILGVIGPNGAGKSTLFNVLSGVQASTEGRVLVGEEPVSGSRASDVTARGVARTFQNIRLFADMTVLENLLVGAHAGLRVNPLAVILRTHGVRARETRARAQAEAILALTGLAEQRETPATTLSYGHQRRVEIARALMTRPRVLLLDEPAAGLNETETAELGDLIRRVRDSGIAIVLVEHDMTLPMTISDRVIVLDHGEKIADGSPDAVRNDERVLEAYLGVEGMTLLEVEDLRVHYDGIEALRGIAFSVGAGELISLIGANGAGKTTLLRTLSGLVRGVSGRARFDGAPLLGRAPEAIARSGLVHVPEGRHVFPRMSVRENLLVAAWGRRRGVVDSVAEVEALFPRLAERRDQAAGTLSGGEQQMLAIGRALMREPRVLMLDEPSMGLAPQMVRTVFGLIARIHESGTTVLLVEQNARLALEIATRAYVLERGVVVADGDPRELAASDDVRRAYLGGA